MHRIAVVYDEMHPLLEQIKAYTVAQGSILDFVHWQELYWYVDRQECIVAPLKQYKAIYLDRMAETKRTYLSQLYLLGCTSEITLKFVNHPLAYWHAHDKAISFALLATTKVSIPTTMVCHSIDRIEQFCCIPQQAYIVKSILGVCAEEVIPFYGHQIPSKEIGQLLNRDGMVIVQQFIENPAKFIWRVDIVNKRVIVCNQRYCYNATGLPICNGTIGGAIVCHDPQKVASTVIQLALQCTEVLRLDVAGIDIIVDKQGVPYVLEINPEPDITFDRGKRLDIFPHNIAAFLLQKAAMLAPHRPNMNEC